MLNTQTSLTEQILGNGTRFLYKHTEGAPRIALSLLIPGGNLREPVPGFSDMLDRLLMKGTHKRSQEQLSIELDSMTLEVDTDTKRDYSMIFATTLEEDLEPSLELISDLFYNASFVEYSREIEKVAGEIQMDLDSPRSRASDLFSRTLFEGTPYNAVSSVIAENLSKLGNVDELKAHYQQFYAPQRIVVSAAGDVPSLKISTLLEQYFPQSSGTIASLEDADVAKHLSSYQIASDKMVTFARDDSSQAHIFKGWLAPHSTHPDYYPLVVLNTILGAAGLTSRLFLELRDKQGLAYNVRSSFEAFLHKGMFYLYIGTEPSNKEKCLQGFITECDKLMQLAVSEKELQEAKENILGRRRVFLETAPQQASYIGANYVLGRSLKEVEALPSLIQEVTSADIQRVAQTYLSQPAVTSVVGPSEIL